MSKKHFIALADSIRWHNRNTADGDSSMFTQSHLNVLADFCKSQNGQFNRKRWLAYIAGECGPNGGEV